MRMPLGAGVRPGEARHTDTRRIERSARALASSHARPPRRRSARVARSDETPALVLRAAAVAVADVEAGGAPWCDGPSRGECLGRARELVEAGKRLAPTSCVAHTLSARLQIAEGNAQGALDDLAPPPSDVVVERGQCLRELGVLAGRVGDNTREDAAIARITTAGCAGDSDCARDFAWIGGVEERRGNTGKALAQYKRAYEHAPDDDALLEAVARLAAAAGLQCRGGGELRTAGSASTPRREKWRTAAQKERDEAVRRAVQL